MGVQLSASARVSASLRPHTRLFLGSIFFAVFLDLLPSEYFGQYRLGGSIGRLFASLSMNSANIFNFPYRREILLLVSFCLSLLSFNFAVGITYKTWYRGFRGFIVCVWKVLRLCGRIIALLFKRRHPKTEEEGLVVKTKKEKRPKNARTESQSGQRGRTGDGNPQGSDSRCTEEKGN